MPTHLPETSTHFALRSAHVPGSENERQPLGALSDDSSCVHGDLVWVVGERRVPHLGFWGPDDACLGDWWDDLSAVVRDLQEGNAALIDTGEQGVPAFFFERRGSIVALSLVAGMSGGAPVDGWQGVEFALEDFVEAVGRFKDEVRRLLVADGPLVLPAPWAERFAQPVGH